MARRRKNKHNLLRNIVLSTLVFMTLGMIAGSLAQNILIFMLTGYITGTDYVIPVWGMFCIYGGIAAVLALTYAIDMEPEPQAAKKARLKGKAPRRRYSHI